MNARQAELRLVQVLGHAATGEQAAIQTVGPLMVGTDEPRDVTRWLGTKHRTAMTTNIVQGVNRAIVAARDDNRIRIHLHRDVVSGSRNFARMPGEEPA